MAKITDNCDLQAKPGVDASPTASVRELVWTFLASALCVASLALLALAVFLYEPSNPDGAQFDARAPRESNALRSR